MKIDCINTMFNLSVDFLYDDDGGFFDDGGFVFDDDFTPFDFAYDTLYDKYQHNKQLCYDKLNLSQRITCRNTIQTTPMFDRCFVRAVRSTPAHAAVVYR